MKTYKNLKELDIKGDEAPVILAYITYLHDGLNGNESGTFFSTVDKFIEDRGDFDAEVKLEEYDAIIESYSSDELINYFSSLISVENRTSVFCYLVDGALSDGVLTEKEKDILLKIQKQLHIEDELAITIVDIFIMKNNPTSY